MLNFLNILIYVVRWKIVFVLRKYMLRYSRDGKLEGKGDPYGKMLTRKEFE